MNGTEGIVEWHSDCIVGLTGRADSNKMHILNVFFVFSQFWHTCHTRSILMYCNVVSFEDRMAGASVETC